MIDLKDVAVGSWVQRRNLAIGKFSGLNKTQDHEQFAYRCDFVGMGFTTHLQDGTANRSSDYDIIDVIDNDDFGNQYIKEYYQKTAEPPTYKELWALLNRIYMHRNITLDHEGVVECLQIIDVLCKTRE